MNTKPVNSRAELIRRLTAIGITDAGHTEERELRIGYNCYGHRGTRVVKKTRRAPLIDPWGRVSFLLEGCRVHFNATRVIGLPGTGLNKTYEVAKKIHALTGNPLLFEVCGSKINGGLKDGQLTRWDYQPLK